MVLIAAEQVENKGIRLDIGALGDFLHEEWNFGSNAVVGWTPVAGGIEIIVTPVLKLFGAADLHRRIFHGDRLMGQGTFQHVAAALGSKTIFVGLEKEVAEREPMDLKHIIDPAIRPYIVSKTRERACFLLDIAGFSLFRPEEQAAQLSLLGYSLNIAEERARHHDIDIDLVRSNTGDGFYVWNRKKGNRADVDLFCVLMLALAHHALQQREVSGPFSPTIRSCFSVGSHYSYHYLDQDSRMESAYIVGDLTIELARLIEHARVNQILIGDFSRLDDETGDRADTQEFLKKVEAKLSQLMNVEMNEFRIAHISAYLTGEKQKGAFVARRLAVRDKHNLEHHAFNAKVNLFFWHEDPIYLGLPDAEVAQHFEDTETH
jgi:hypothetical protein